MITKLLDNLKSNDMSCSVRLFALLTLGGIGKHRYYFKVKTFASIFLIETTFHRIDPGCSMHYARE